MRRRLIFPAIGIIAGFSLAACSGGSNSVLGPINSFGPGSSNAQVRFVNGSPDSGPVQVFIDNTQQFCTNGTTGNSCTLAYGAVTSYAVNLSAGNHAVVLRDANGNQISLPSGQLSVNSGFRYTLALTGEMHPSSTGSALGLVTIQEQPFNTPSGGAAVNFNNASPAATTAAGGSVQFGYFMNSNASATTNVGQPVPLGGESNPSLGGLPAASLNAPLTFFAGAGSSGTINATPSQIDATDCGSNSLPCANNNDNLSLYLIDGPADSTTPGAAPYPGGAGSASTATFVGVFDPNGS